MSTTTSAPLADSSIMLRRNFKHIVRNPVTVFNGALMPVLLLLMFVYVFGSAFKVGERYIQYATPGMILLAITYGLSGTAVAVNSDMTKGIINRFKVMDISRGAVLTGHVIASMLRSLIAVTAIIGVALLMGFRPSASFLDWLGVIGLVALVCFAASWLTVALGLAANNIQLHAAGDARLAQTFRSSGRPSARQVSGSGPGSSAAMRPSSGR